MLLFVNIKNINAQKLDIKLNYPNPFFVNSDDILNIQITNPTNKEIEVSIIGIWNYNGAKAVTLVTDRFTLKSGLNQIHSSLIAISEKSYYNQTVEEIESSTGVLPIGNYTACISIKCMNPDCSGAGANIISNEQNSCINVSVVNPTPLLLNTPFHNSYLKTDRPNFSWIPPMPIASDGDVSYRLVLVKKTRKSQSCNDAIKRNRPLLDQNNIMNPVLIYPGDLDILDSGEYAWQVSAFKSNNFVCQSDAWCFNIGEEKILNQKNEVYVKLSTTDNNTHHIRSNLFFSFIESYSSQKLSVKLFNQKGKEILLNQAFYTKYGENQFVLNLEQLGLEKGPTYHFKVKDQVGKIYNLNFQIL